MSRETVMDKEKFLEAVRGARAALEALLEKINTARMTEPGVEGAQSVKDILAHIAWYEREMVELLHTHLLAGSDL